MKSPLEEQILKEFREKFVISGGYVDHESTEKIEAFLSSSLSTIRKETLKEVEKIIEDDNFGYRNPKEMKEGLLIKLSHLSSDIEATPPVEGKENI